ncbi:uncharacterized protein K452DRAFT_292837 [Aplosporella prunicola CBS 121167]|uniref:Tubulin-tyrosine ligase n=1 Tax=Aplosporella prunicola CBS 121167 TaxID=1176127 RepID=A0A6A6AWD4_9PEZI|nr:uncharacterized protein K452DRAFT_292837 [Aplosporella prunicola CBS 121167]KAF2135906.1 hypothetical protein K452DRAFT_292837 [Aplosporella prunicola CBS 121167]
MVETGKPIYALIDYEDPYVQPLILSAFKSKLPESSYELIKSLDEYPSSGGPLLQFRAYEALDFDSALERPRCLINAYVIRKALIRKHYLATTCHHWVVKHPDSVLKSHVKPSVDFELDYAEFLDDALVEAFELHESWQRNEGKSNEEKEWWILKPGMSDRGQGIRLFSSEEELQAIFDEWEAERPDSDDEGEGEDEEEEGEEEVDGASANGSSSRISKSHSATDARSDAGSASSHKPLDFSQIQVTTEQKNYVITSQLRHFIAQPYIHPPLQFEGRKFHIRTYVLAVGALKVYVYQPMLALFAAAPYAAPWASSTADGGSGPDLRAHLTNTCLQGSEQREGSVRAFWDLPDQAEDAASPLNGVDGGWKAHVFDQICSVTGAAFEAAAREMMIHFQPLPSAFELFGLDFMVDEAGTAWLLEVNAFPDFRQTGDELQGLVEGLMEEVVDVAVKPFFGLGDEAVQGTEKMRMVADVDLGKR